MKKILLIPVVFSFLLPLAHAQIKLPDIIGGIKDHFKKAESISVTWNCPVPEGSGVEVLPSSQTLKVSSNKNGKISISPNIFGKRVLSKNFFNRTFRKITKKDSSRHVYDYTTCLETFYESISKQADIDPVFVTKIREEVSGSDYFKEDEDKVIVSLYQSTPEHLISSAKVKEELTKFCSEDGSEINDILKSKKVATFIENESNNFGSTKTFEQSCLNRLSASLTKAKDDYLKNLCDTAAESVCESIKTDVEELGRNLLVAVDLHDKSINEFQGLEAFCGGQSDNIDFATDSIYLIDDIIKKTRSQSYTITSMNYGFNCLKSLRDKIRAEKSGPEISSFLAKLNEAIKGFEAKVIQVEEGLFKNYINEDDHKKFVETVSKEGLDCNEVKNLSFYQYNHIEYDNILSKNIDNVINSDRDGTCLPQVLQNYLLSKTSLLKNAHAQEAFCRKNLTPRCIEDRKARDVIVDNYKAMFTKIYGERGVRAFENQIACNIDDENPLESLLTSIEESKNILHCLDIKPGEYKVVRPYENRDVTTGNYALRRLDDKNYEVVLNLRFTSNSGASVSPEDMRARVEQCAQDVSPFLKGTNQEQLTFKILDADNLSGVSTEGIPAPNSINIEKAGFRSHSRAYEETIDCAVITHELLHLFGLCDEYEEKWNAAAHNYACRVVPKTASIMKNHYEAFNKGVGKVNQCECNNDTCKKIVGGNDEEIKKMYLSATFYDVSDYQFRTDYCDRELAGRKVNFNELLEEEKHAVRYIEKGKNSITIESRYIADYYPRVDMYALNCACPEGDEACVGKMDRLKTSISQAKEIGRVYCPSGARTVDSKFGTPEEVGEQVTLKNNRFTTYKKPEWDSLLHPAHFDRILGGSCADAGKDYLECMVYAYERKPKTECNVPEKCKDDSYYLGVRK